jgi:anionic cell wall polymer biosynthesis LytR-Cps2A-Psr (LCP) family protein
MKNNSFGKIVFLIIVVVAIAMIVYPKLTASNNGSAVKNEPSASELQVQRGSQSPSQSDIQTMIQSQKQTEGVGEAQLAEAVKSGKPTMILFHSDG